MDYIFASAGFITGLFYITIILFSKTIHISKWYLIAFIAILNIALLPILFMNGQLFPPIWLNASFELLWGPVLYFYISSLLKEKNNHKWLIIHSIPFLTYYSLSFILDSPIFPGPPEEYARHHIDVIQNSAIIFTIIQLSSLVTYSLLTLFLLNKRKKNIKNLYSYKDSYLTIRWSYVIIIFFVSSYILVLFTEQIIGTHTHIPTGKLHTVLISSFIYILGYLGIKQQPVYLNRVDSQKTYSEMADTQDTSLKEKYSKNKLDDELKEEYKTKLLAYIENEKPYLQPKLSINELSNALQIPKHFLSQIINNSLGHTFYSLINQYRVNEVKKRISEDAEDKFTLLAIAFDSGFNSKSGFNQNFKLETGMTPLEFKKMSNS